MSLHHTDTYSHGRCITGFVLPTLNTPRGTEPDRALIAQRGSVVCPTSRSDSPRAANPTTESCGSTMSWRFPDCAERVTYLSFLVLSRGSSSCRTAQELGNNWIQSVFEFLMRVNEIEKDTECAEAFTGMNVSPPPTHTPRPPPVCDRLWQAGG